MGSSTSAGIGLMVLGVLVVSEIITRVTGMYSHWLFVIPGILIGLLAVRAIR